MVHSLWRFTQWRGVFTSKQSEQKTLEFKLKLVRKLKATTSFFNFLSFKKWKAAINLQNFIAITLHKNMMRIPKKIECCVYIMHEKFSGSFRDYTIFIYKFKTDECFWKLRLANPQPPPLKKSTPPFLLTPPLKIEKLPVPPSCQHWKIFSTRPLHKSVETIPARGLLLMPWYG